jgi:hypothetical protein
MDAEDVTTVQVCAALAADTSRTLSLFLSLLLVLLQSCDAATTLWATPTSVLA